MVFICTGVYNAKAAITIEAGKNQSSGEGWSYDFVDNKLTMKYRYHYVSTATLSYETIGAYWTDKPTDKNPKGAEGIKKTKLLFFPEGTGGPKNDGVTKVDYIKNGESCTDITYEAFVIRDILEKIYGTLEPDTPYKVYLSEIYCLKERSTSKDEWTFKTGKTYESLSAIRKAANWSDSTYNGFENYYDIEIVFILEGADLNVAYVNVEDGTVIRDEGKVASVIIGDTYDYSLPSLDPISYNNNLYEYTEKMQLSTSGIDKNDWKESSPNFTFEPTEKGEYTLYVGYKVVYPYD